MTLWAVWIAGGIAAIFVLALIGVIAWELVRGLCRIMRPAVLRTLERVYARLDRSEEDDIVPRHYTPEELVRELFPELDASEQDAMIQRILAATQGGHPTPQWAIDLADDIWCLPETPGFPVATDD